MITNIQLGTHIAIVLLEGVKVMKPLKQKQFNKLMKNLGAIKIRQLGSHMIYQLNNNTGCVPYGKEISPGTLRQFLSVLGVDYKRLKI